MAALWTLFYFYLISFHFTDVDSHYISQAILKLVIFLLLSPGSQDERFITLCFAGGLCGSMYKCLLSLEAVVCVNAVMGELVLDSRFLSLKHMRTLTFLSIDLLQTAVLFHLIVYLF